MRKVLLLEPNYRNKYPPMGLMKLATYYRRKHCDVRFFKGDLDLLGATLLCEEFLSVYASCGLERYAQKLIAYIKTGQKSFLNDIWLDNSVISGTLKDYRTRFKNKVFPKFDVVCVATLFTFYWQVTIDTIEFAKSLCKADGSIFVGGIAASIVSEHIENKTGIKPIIGLLDKPGMLEKGDKIIIDELPLDYSILDEIDYKYPASNAYFAYTTRGCIRKCSFCAVPRIEPTYKDFIALKKQIDSTECKFGKKKDLLLMDNNVLASKRFDAIVDEIKSAGFAKDAAYIPSDRYAVAIDNLRKGYNIRAMLRVVLQIYEETIPLLDGQSQGRLYYERDKLNCLSIWTSKPETILKLDGIFRPMYEATRKLHKLARYVDFNQGNDARLVTEQKMAKLAEVNIRPLRIAFDAWDERKVYEHAVECAVGAGIEHLSNYMLYNFKDRPVDLYYRLRLNIHLCEKHRKENVTIYSFPMKYHPISDPEYFRNRLYIGRPYWNRKYIRAVQAVLNSTKGKIGRGKNFFEKAFGRDTREFKKILLMPETFIIYRLKYEKTLASQWWDKWQHLSNEQQKNARKIIEKNVFTDEALAKAPDSAIRDVLKYYQIQRR
ncbi:MAG: hypothetical protein MdMp014T_0534 [Treponematales bacterium]